MATIGFLRFGDFLAEIAGTTAPVRVEAYYKNQPTSLAPVEIYNFFVECASVLDGDTLVFRFQTSRCQVMGRHDREVISRQRQMETAAHAIHQYLEVDEGLDVRPGLIAAAEESKTAGEIPEFILKILRNGKEPNNE